MTLTNKRKRISGILLVFAAIACIMLGVGSMHKTAAADGEFECSETKCLLSSDKTGMLIATAIKNYDYVYEIGYEFTKGSASENDFTATDRYFREISKGGKSVTAGDIFGSNYADAALAVWEITYDSNIEYEFKFYAKVGKLGSDGQTVVKQDPEKIVYSETKNVVTYTEVKHYIRNINGSYTLKETETNVPCMGTPSAKTYAGYEYGSKNVVGSVCNMYYELEGVTFYSANNIYKWKPDVSSYQIIDGGATTYNSEYRPATKKIETISQSGEGAYFGIDGIGDRAGKYLIFAIKTAFTAIDPTVPQCNNAGNATISYFDANGDVTTYDKTTSEWYVAVIEITEALVKNGNIGLDFFCWSAGTAIVGDYAFISQEQYFDFFGTTYSAVNHYVRMGDGSFALKDSETDVTCVGTPTAKSYANRVYSSTTITDTVCDMFYEYDGITFNSANDIYKWKGVISSYRVIDGGAMAYDGKYRPTTKKIETISQSGEGAYFGFNDIGDKAGKYLVFAIKNGFTTTAIDPTVPQWNGAGNATISYFDVNGNATTYDKKVTEWYVATVEITEALATNGNIGLDFFCWSMGAVTVGDYAFVTSEQLETLFSTTYSTVNHYARNIDGSFTLVETENNVTCIGLPTAKNYSAHVYSTATVIDGVCNMFYEYEEITFNSANDIYKWNSVSTYQLSDGGAIAYDGKYRTATKLAEIITQSGNGAYLGFNNITDKAGKYLVFAIKNNFEAIDTGTPPQKNNDGKGADIRFFDENGNSVTYDRSNSAIWYVAVIEITDELAAKGNIGLDLVCWSTGSAIVGDYAFITQEQLNLLGYYSGSETSDIQVNGWVAPESYSDDMLEKIAAAGLTSVSFAAAGTGTQYIDPSDLSASKDIINRYAKYGINVYTVGGVANFASMGDFANYGNVLGLMLDEPNKSQIDEIAAAVDAFNLANVGNKVLIVNLLPSYASAVASDFSTYSAYLQYLYDKVLSKLKCELWISVDRYPIVRDAKGNPTLDSGWLDDVEAVATFAKTYGLKKNFFIQTMPYGLGGFNDSHDRTPTKADITLQYYALLAYGYDSISLFCLGTPAPDGTTFLDGQNAMINRNNETTDIYTAVKEVNEELNKFDFILNRFSWDAAVLKTSSLFTSVQAEKIGLKDISSTKNALFSHLVDETRGREAYCVVNYNDTSLNYTNTIILTFSGETILTVIQNGGFRTVTSTSGEFTFTLGVGESIIVIK